MRMPTYVNSRLQSEMLSRQFDLVNRIQQQISSGKKLIDSSDDPILAKSINSAKDYINQLESYKTNLISAKNRSSLIESGVSASINAVTRASELIKAAQSDTASNSDRVNMARELKGLLNTLESQANVRDSNGDYIFSGTSTTTQPFTLKDGVYQYTGSHDSSVINISKSTTTVYNENGQYVFGDMMQGNGSVVVSQGSPPNVGTAETSVPTIVDQSAITDETFTITFVTNSAGETGYQVVGSTSGQIIPLPPLTTPADAPKYNPHEPITFNGIAMTIDGDPAIGDSFVASPSKKENIMEILRQTINLLNKPITNNSDKAAFHQQIGELSESVNTAASYLTHYLSELGYREKEIDNQEAVSQNQIIGQKIILDKFESADMAELIPNLQAATLSMELTQKTHSKLQEFFQDLMRNIL